MRGRYLLGLSNANRQDAGAATGDEVEVEVEVELDHVNLRAGAERLGVP